jgi:hypothetical protein
VNPERRERFFDGIDTRASPQSSSSPTCHGDGRLRRLTCLASRSTGSVTRHLHSDDARRSYGVMVARHLAKVMVQVRFLVAALRNPGLYDAQLRRATRSAKPKRDGSTPSRVSPGLADGRYRAYEARDAGSIPAGAATLRPLTFQGDGAPHERQPRAVRVRPSALPGGVAEACRPLKPCDARSSRARGTFRGARFLVRAAALQAARAGFDPLAPYAQVVKPANTLASEASAPSWLEGSTPSLCTQPPCLGEQSPWNTERSCSRPGTSRSR